MKRILITLAALAISSVGYTEDLDSYASVLNDNPAPFKDYSAFAETQLEDHGNVLPDPAPQSRVPSIRPGLESEISVGNSTFFDTDAESPF